MKLNELENMKLIEIALDIKSLINEFEKIMPKRDDTKLALDIVRYGMLSLSNRIYEHEIKIDWGVSIDKYDTGINK